MEPPSRDQARQTLSELDPRQVKIVAGLFAKLIKEPTRARDQEWVLQQLTEITVLAGEFEADSPDQAIRAVQDYLQTHAEALLRASFLLFQRVGLDLKALDQSFTFEDAMHSALGYLPSES